MQAEVRTKANTIEKNRGLVKVAQGLVASVNPEGLSSADWKVDMTQKLQERLDLQQQRDKLQQASFILCTSAVNAAMLLLNQSCTLKAATEENLMVQAQKCVHRLQWLLEAQADVQHLDSAAHVSAQTSLRSTSLQKLMSQITSRHSDITRSVLHV
jgi:hypothetical protein